MWLYDAVPVVCCWNQWMACWCPFAGHPKFSFYLILLSKFCSLRETTPPFICTLLVNKFVQLAYSAASAKCSLARVSNCFNPHPNPKLRQNRGRTTIARIYIRDDGNIVDAGLGFVVERVKPQPCRRQQARKCALPSANHDAISTCQGLVSYLNRAYISAALAAH